MADRRTITRLRLTLLALIAVAFGLAIAAYLRTGQVHAMTFAGVGAGIAIVLLTGRRQA